MHCCALQSVECEVALCEHRYAVTAFDYDYDYFNYINETFRIIKVKATHSDRRASNQHFIAIKA